MNREDLSIERKKQMLSEIKAYFEEELGEPVGDLKATLFLEFILEKMGPFIYNQAIEDAYSYMSDRLEDIFSLDK